MKEDPLPYKSILFVCDGNTCRSPMAEVLLKRILEELGAEDKIQVRSGGIALHARDGSLPSLDAKMLMKEEGILFPEDFCSKDLKRHINLIEEADLILTMTREQKERIRQFQETRGEVYTLKEFIGEKGDIADPEGYEESLYAECKEEIKSCLKKITPKILPNLDPS